MNQCIYRDQSEIKSSLGVYKKKWIHRENKYFCTYILLDLSYIFSVYTIRLGKYYLVFSIYVQYM